MQERLEWVSIPANQDLVFRIVKDPIKYIADWENADEPWLFWLLQMSMSVSSWDTQT